MSVAVNVSADGGARLPVARARIADLVRAVASAERVPDAMISVAFVSRRAIARLNRDHLGHAGPTDVISFGFASDAGDASVIGDIYICLDVARENARRYGSGVREELARLAVHGTLHVLGYAHPEGDERTSGPMWQRQEQLVERLFLAPR